MDDEAISTFCAITETDPQRAQQYLQLTDGNVEQAVELFFSNPDLGASAAATTATAPTQSNRDDPITIDDDDMEDADVQETGSRQVGGATFEDDEAMARRLQEEMYGAGGGGGGGGGGGFGGTADEDGVRAPMARTTETLVGPGSDWRDDPSQMNAAIAEQLLSRQRRQRGAPGIFNQREDSPSIWSSDDHSTTPNADQQASLSRATGGASDATSKSNLLAQLFRPPFDLIHPTRSWSSARDDGKEEQKWLLINIQDPSIFDCQVLNRDIWKNASIRDTIKEHFLFLQYNKGDPAGQEYINYYFSSQRDNEAAYPHIAIVDPRTGEQVKTWSGSPAPKPNEFLMDLHEFLDRYSLKMEARNPVQRGKKEKKKDVAQMSEEEMLEMAMMNSLDQGGGGSKARDDEDPDALTRSIGDLGAINGKGKAPATSSAIPAEPSAMDINETGPSQPVSNGSSPFDLISSASPHTEPDSSVPASETTRIQFRYSGGRVVRRFMLTDPVRRLYEWLKAQPLDGREGQAFELIDMGKNLIDYLDSTVVQAGLKNATVMIEFVEGD